MKVYIYTIPKAGTYFLADYIARLGFRNTGFHVSRNSFLNTTKFDLDTNARFPAQSQEELPFERTLRRMKHGDVAFGHFAVPLMCWLYPEFFFVCAYRHPRKTLMSEFIDFRFRREDVAWVSREKIPDDREAFTTYLANHGPGHMTVFSQMLAMTLLRSEPLCKRFQGDRFHFLNFDNLMNDPAEAEALAVALGRPAILAGPAIEETKQTETKTKATGLEIDREALWTKEAEAQYAKLEAEAVVERGRQLGWAI